MTTQQPTYDLPPEWLPAGVSEGHPVFCREATQEASGGSTRTLPHIRAFIRYDGTYWRCICARVSKHETQLEQAAAEFASPEAAAVWWELNNHEL